MTKRIRKKSVTRKSKGIFNRFRLTESYTSLILGAIVVLVVGILFVFFARGNRITQTSSTKDVSIDNQSQDLNVSSTYTIKPGDDLWTISENIYNDGYKWVEIARINKLENPSLIYSGDKLIVTAVIKEQVAPNIQPTVNSDQVIENNSIVGSSYTVVTGDNLWDIAVRAYGDGFKWVEIARVNNLANPDLIHPGNIFIILR